MNMAEHAWPQTAMKRATDDFQPPHVQTDVPPEERIGRQSSSGSNLHMFYQQHQDLVAAQRNLHEGMTDICQKLHSVTQENITLHQRLLEVRRAHKALRATHGIVLEQLRAVCTLNQELEARVQLQAQLLNGYSSGASLIKTNGNAGHWNVADLVGMGSCEVDFASLNQLFHESFPASGQSPVQPPPSEEQQTSGFFGGLDLIGEAIEQMECEEKTLEDTLPEQPEQQQQQREQQQMEVQQQQQHHKRYQQQQACGGGSDDSAAASAPPFKHSETSTSEHLEPTNSQQAGSFLGMDDEEALPEFSLTALCKGSVMSPALARPVRTSGRRGCTSSTRAKAAPNEARAPGRSAVAPKGKVAKRKKSRY